MDNSKLIFLLLLLFINNPVYATAAWVHTWVDGPAPSRYEYVNGAMRSYFDVPKYGGHYVSTVSSQPFTNTGGQYYSGGISGSNAAAMTGIKIPYGYAAGAGVTLAAVALKPALAKAGTFLLRANPYVATAMTLAWLGNAGYQYFADTDSFTQRLPSSSPTLKYKGLNASQGGYVLGPFSSGQDSCEATGGTTNPPYYYGHPAYDGNVSCGTQYGWVQIVSPTCPADYHLVGNECVINSGVLGVPVTPAEVEDGLANAPMTPNGDTDDAKKGILDELIKNGVDPEIQPAIITGPAITPGGTTTETRPDGTTLTTGVAYNHTYYNTNYYDTTQTTTTTTTPPGTTTTTTGPPAPPQKEQRTDCDKYPDNIGCSKYGTVPAPDVITVVNVPLSLNVGGYDSGSCPAPQTYTVHGQNYQMSNDYICTLASSSKPLFVALAWLVAGFIVLSPIKG